MAADERSVLAPGVDGVDLPRGVKPARMTVTTVTDQPGALLGRDRYRVAVSFRHPADAAGFVEGDSATDAGTSGLVIPVGQSRLVIEDPGAEGREFRIELLANEEGRLANAVAELTVDSAHVARRIVTVHLGAILARLAFETDGLVAIRSISVTRLSTGQSETAFLYRGPDATLTKWPEWQHHAGAYFRAAFADYREGLNSTNAYWAVLCFIRVIEGTRKYATKLAETGKARGIDLHRERVRLEAAPDIQGPFRPWVGKTAGEIAELLTPYRDPTAHGLDPSLPRGWRSRLGRQPRRQLRQRPRRDRQRAVQDRADPAARSLADGRVGRARDARLGRLVEPPPAPRRLHRCPARRVRGPLLRSAAGSAGRVNQRRGVSTKPRAIQHVNRCESGCVPTGADDVQALLRRIDSAGRQTV